MRLSFRLVSAALFAGLTLPLSAQTRSTWSVQGSGLFAGLGGGTYSRVDPGVGFELQARRRLNQFWSLGCGFQGTYHSYSGLEGDFNLQGGFCEPRRVLDIGSESVFPYLSARVAVLHRSESDSTGFEASANGTTLNAGTGIMIPFGAATSGHPTLLELGVSAGYTWFGDISVSQGKLGSFTRPAGSGWNFVLRAGIAVGL